MARTRIAGSCRPDPISPDVGAGGFIPRGQVHP